MSANDATAAQLRAISLEYSHQELAAATKSWQPDLKLGTGCYGAVYKGELKDGSEVAIKAIDLGALIGQGESPDDAGFEEEVTVLSKFRHPNLVTLLGWGQNGLSRYLVYEYLAGGDVFRRLHRSRATSSSRHKPFHWHERLSVCLDAATGLSHMHNSTPKAFHRDIKSANILLDRHGAAKMADFGLSVTGRQANAKHVDVRTVAGTPGYKCPIYARSGRFTEGSEAYSFGMVMLEMLTGLDPSAHDASAPGGISFPISCKLQPTRPGAAGRCTQAADTSASWPAALAKAFTELALRSVDVANEKNRPVFVEIVRAVRGMMEQFPATSAPAAADVISAAPHGVSVAVAPAPAPASPVALAPPPAVPSKAPLLLHLVRSAGVADLSALSPDMQRLRLKVADAPDAGEAIVAVGRSHQAKLFEAWLPDPGQRAKISRKAFEVCWSGAGAGLRLLSHGSNPVLVDGRVVKKSTSAPLKVGSEVVLSYETTILLRFRCLPAGDEEDAQDAQPAFSPPARYEAPPAAAGAGPEPLWAVDQAYQLAAREGIERRLEHQMVVLQGQDSLEAAVRDLNSGKVSCPGGVCLVCLKAGTVHHLLYQADRKPDAMASLLLACDVHGPEGGKGEASSPDAASKSSSSGDCQAPQGEPSRRRFSLAAEAQARQPGQGVLGWRLVCVQAEGLSEAALEAMPEELRCLDLMNSGTMKIGLHHQPQQFEAWLPDPALRANVAGTHLEVGAGKEGLRAGIMSSSPVSVDVDICGPGEARNISQGQLLGFIRREGNLRVKFLTLRVQGVEIFSGKQLRRQQEAPQLQVLEAVRQEQQAGHVAAAAAFLPAAQPPASPSLAPGLTASLARFVAGQEGLSDPKSPLANLSSATKKAMSDAVKALFDEEASRLKGEYELQIAKFSRDWQALQPSALAEPTPAPASPQKKPAEADLGARSDPTRAAASPEFFLELCGSGVHTLPLAQRRVGPLHLGEQPLLIGSRHQPELYQMALRPECHGLVERDMFCLAFEGGEFWLFSLSTGVIWRDRVGESPVALQRDGLITLKSGDRIAIGEAGGASSANAVRALRGLSWRFQCTDAEGGGAPWWLGNRAAGQ